MPRPLLLLHGFLAHAHWWDFIGPWLATQYRVIAPDFGGMGDSEHREQYSHALFSDEIAGIVGATGIAGCTAIGHSFGGRALLYACERHPGSHPPRHRRRFAAGLARRSAARLR